MAIRHFPKDKQAKGAFNAGAILENKPIGFPQDGGESKPFSNLLYWAHAYTADQASTIGEHPHQGFEIMSFVIKGAISHYDNQHQSWKPLKAGDAQIIRAGQGITHAEHVEANSAFFQIWVDPGLNESLNQAPSYDDYPASSFKQSHIAAITITTYIGANAPMKANTPGLQIEQWALKQGQHQVALEDNRIYGFYVVSGSIIANGLEIEAGGFLKIEEETSVIFTNQEEATLFLVSTWQVPPYTTYAQRMMGLA